MLIIGKNKKRKIAGRLGFLWVLICRLPPTDFDMATEILCYLCHDLGVEWELVHNASTQMAEIMASHRKVGADNERKAD